MLNQIRVKQVTIEGTMISAKSCCLLMKERIPLPNFLWVEEILVSANKKLFCGRIIQTQYYLEHFHRYVVREIEEKAVVSDLDKRHVQPLHCAKAQHLRGITSLITQSYHFTHQQQSCSFQ